MSLSRDSVILMGGRGAAFVVSMLAPVLLVRLFSVPEYGEYRQIMLIVTTAAAILPLGMPNSLFYFFPHYPADKSIYLMRTIAVFVAAGMIFWLLLLIFSEQVAVFFGNQKYVHYGSLIGLVTFTCLLSMLIETVLIADGKVALSTKIMAFSRTLRSASIIVGAILGGVIGTLYGLLTVFTVIVFGSIFYFAKEYHITFSRYLFRNSGSHLKYALPLGFGGIFGLLTDLVDKFMVSHFMSTAYFAIYAVGSYELPLISILFASIGDVVLPQLVRLKAFGSKEEIVKLWHSAIEKSVLVAIPVFVFFVVFANDFITTVFTAKYVGAVNIFRISLVTVVLESTRYGMITRTYARTGFLFFLSVIGFALVVPACWLGIRYYGGIGAIAAVAVTRITMVASELIYSRYILGLGWLKLLPFPEIGKLCTMSVACALLALLISIFCHRLNNWFHLFILLSSFFVSYSYVTNYFGLWRVEQFPMPGPVRAFAQKMLFA